jgi:hypothetical protein
MKTKTIRLMLTVTALFSLALVTACSDDDKPGPAKNREELATTIADATVLAETSEEGTIEDQFQAGSIAELEAAIASATEIFMDEDATQNEVNAANENLKSAIEDFMGKKVAPIAATDLIARWKFDEGTGTVTLDDSPNGFDGEFKAGHAFWGAGSPTWATDRHGDIGKAIYFDNGANIEVPYNTKLNPDNITITLWMKQDVNTPNIVNNQYMVAMNRWNGYKFNMQDVPKPFFTVNPQEAPGTHINRDSAQPDDGLPQGTWYHVAVTFSGDHMIFYINGTETEDWSDFEASPILDISANPVNLTIGQDLPTNKYTATEGDFFVDWGGHFIGAMDDIRLYKSALTAQQVLSIYNNEKPD